jgi:hypothetical protein
MTSGAYSFYNPERIEIIDGFVKQYNHNPTVFFYCTLEYSRVRKLYIISNRLIKSGKKAIRNPQKYLGYILFLKENEDSVREVLYKLKVKSKRIPYNFNLRNLLVENANILNKDVDSLIKADIEWLRKEEAEMTYNKHIMTVDEVIKGDLMTAVGGAILGASASGSNGAIIGGVIGMSLYLIIYCYGKNK